jgi:lysophospholipase L1-like esterase
VVTLAKFGILGFSALLAIGFGEITIRVIAPQQLISIRPDIWQPVDGLGWIVHPEIDTTINTGERTVRVITDEQGFRVGERGRREGDHNLLLLGDSFTQALQVEHEQSLAGLMEDRLSSALRGETVAVRNGGVDGWEPSQYLLRARKELAQNNYDLLIVAFYLGNDVIPKATEHFPPREAIDVHRLQLPSTLAWKDWVNSLLYPVNDWLEVRSHLFVLLKSRLRGVLLRLGLSADYFPRGVRLAEADSPMWDVTLEVLREINTVAANHQTPALFVLIPAPFTVDPLVFEQIRAGFDVDPESLDASQPGRLIAERLESAGIAFASAVEPFIEEHQAGNAVYGSIDRHLSPQGHVILYEFLEERLRKTLTSRGVPNKP